jgi:hypothetical protein
VPPKNSAKMMRCAFAVKLKQHAFRADTHVGWNVIMVMHAVFIVLGN